MIKLLNVALLLLLGITSLFTSTIIARDVAETQVAERFNGHFGTTDYRNDADVLADKLRTQLRDTVGAPSANVQFTKDVPFSLEELEEKNSSVRSPRSLPLSGSSPT